MGNLNNKQEEEIKPTGYNKRWDNIDYDVTLKKYIAKIDKTENYKTYTFVLGYYDTELEACKKIDTYFRVKFNIPPIENPIY